MKSMKMKKTTAYPSLLFSVAVLIASLIMLGGCLPDNLSGHAYEKSPGSLYVSSFPGNAAVYVDNEGKVMAGHTPKIIKGLSPGIHEVMIAKNGYAPFTKKILIKPNTISKVTAVLRQGRPGESRGGHLSPSTTKSPSKTPKTPNTGSLFVSSTPSANVLLDGRHRGTTPLKLTGVAAGRHFVVIQRADYKPYRATVTIARGETVNVNAVLSKNQLGMPYKNLTNSTKSTRGYGLLYASSYPIRARVYLDRLIVGETPLTLGRVSVGRHTILIRKKGYEDYTQEVQIRAKQRTKVYARLKISDVNKGNKYILY